MEQGSAGMCNKLHEWINVHMQQIKLVNLGLGKKTSHSDCLRYSGGYIMLHIHKLNAITFTIHEGQSSVYIWNKPICNFIAKQQHPTQSEINQM